MSSPQYSSDDIKFIIKKIDNVRFLKMTQTRFGGYLRWGTRPANNLMTLKFNVEMAIRKIGTLADQVPAPKSIRQSADLERLRFMVEYLTTKLNTPAMQNPAERTPRPSADLERLRFMLEGLEAKLNTPAMQDLTGKTDRPKKILERIMITANLLLNRLTEPAPQVSHRRKPHRMIETIGTIIKKMAFYEPTFQKAADGIRVPIPFEQEPVSVRDAAFAADPVKNLSTMGYMWSEYDLSSHPLRQKILQKVGNKFGKISKYTGQGIRYISRQAFTGFVEGFDKINDAMDVYGVLQLFTDGMNYDPNQIENDSVMYLNADQLKNAALSITRQQIQVMTDYNTNKVTPYNIDPVNLLKPDWPKPLQKFPLIIGPLEQLDVEESGGEVWRVQARLQYEIDTVMDTLLRDMTRSYTIALRNLVFSMAGYNYSDLLLYPSPSLAYFLADSESGTYNFSNDNPTEYDKLLKDAYTIVCRSHGGIVYEDLHPVDTSLPSRMQGQRPRFQCSWPRAQCREFTRNWLNKSSDPSAWTPGIFGEWFEFSEIDYTTLSGTDRALLGQSSGQSGACMASTYVLGQTCSYYKGTYDYENRQCVFSEEYCQALGSCFNETSKTCYLPTKAMQAASIFFGDGGPRAWIRANGCKFTSNENNLETALNLTGIGMLFTGSGQRMFSDALANRSNWSQGFRTVLSDPTYTMNFISSVFGVASIGRPFLSKISLMALATGVTAGIMAGMDAMKASWVTKTAPPTDPREYSVGGLIRNQQGVQQPNRLAFTDGWVTKPIKLHSFGNIADKIRVEQYPGQKTIKFFPDYDGSVDINTWMNCNPNPKKGKCVDEPGGMVRAASDGNGNKVWCFPYKPSANFFDPRVGDPAEETFDRGNPYLTNASWNGKDNIGYVDYPWGPNGPGANDGPAFKGGDTSNEHWYYQLVYDRKSIKSTIIWDTASLLVYFTERTISDMRREYCIDRLAEISDTTPVPNQCWGYVSVKTSKYLFMPMTVLKYVSAQVLP
jgi:hypothetical protein